MATSSGGLQFTFSIPTNIVFGLGSLDGIGTHSKALGFKRPLIVTDKVMSQSDGMKQIVAKLSEAGLGSAVWDGIAAEPFDTTLTELKAMGPIGTELKKNTPPDAALPDKNTDSPKENVESKAAKTPDQSQAMSREAESP